MIRPFTTPEKIEAFKKFITPLIGREYTPQPNSVLKELLNWHNDLYPMNKKHSIICATCVATAWRRCIAYYNFLSEPVKKVEEVELTKIKKTFLKKSNFKK